MRINIFFDMLVKYVMMYKNYMEVIVKFISFVIFAYLLLSIYEIVTKEHHCIWKNFFALLLGMIKCIAEVNVYAQYMVSVVLCSMMVLYSGCIRSKNSNIKNLQFVLVSYGVNYFINMLVGCVCGVVAGLLWENGQQWAYLVLSIGRLIVIGVLHKYNGCFEIFKQTWVLRIGVIATIILLFIEQELRTAFTKASHNNLVYVGVACTYVAILFAVLWLLDHYKMEKLQKMYADDNRQMSQKLHRSKEILPMIANYVSNMDGTQDEEMRKKLEAVCHDYGKELGGAEMSAEFFETTGIDLADLLLRTKIIECGEQDIELNVFVSTQINEDMKRLDISDGEITRLLGDLLRNAINAVSKLQDKMILLLIARNENDCVLIRIYDSGIPFPPYILEHFGERGYTTWGTGNGLADLMDTVTRVHGSIEINMDMDPGDVFTKEIYICFDGKNTINIVKKENTQREIDANVCMET